MEKKVSLKKRLKKKQNERVCEKMTLKYYV